MTLSAQNRNFHWVNHKMVINRISGNELAADRPKTDLLKVPNLRFIPTLKDHQRQRENCISYVLVSRMLFDYFDALEPLNEICIKHIAHKYHKEMSQKSVKVHCNTVIVMLYYTTKIPPKVTLIYFQLPYQKAHCHPVKFPNQSRMMSSISSPIPVKLLPFVSGWSSMSLKIFFIIESILLQCFMSQISTNLQMSKGKNNLCKLSNTCCICSSQKPRSKVMFV